MLFDYHIHSDFSEDCETPMEDTVKAAIKKGLTEICFTEHIDYDYPDPDFTFDLDIESYSAELARLQTIYREAITIKKGVEIGIQPHLFSRYNQLLDANHFDFIILSMHATDGKDLHNGDYFKGQTPSEAYETFYEELLYCVKNFDNYSVLGHLDLIKRYKKLDTNEDFHHIIEQIFQTIIPKGKGIEVNASGFGYGLNSALPSRDILELYKKCGGEIITIGSDSHFTKHLAYNFTDILNQLREIGFRYVATFTDREPTLHPIEKLL